MVRDRKFSRKKWFKMNMELLLQIICFSGVLKKVYSNIPIQNTQKLQYRIYSAFAELNSIFLSNTVRAFTDRLVNYLERETKHFFVFETK